MNNPFQRLDKEKFLNVKQKENAYSVVPNGALQNGRDEEINDQALFLRAMDNVSRQVNKKKYCRETIDCTLSGQINIPQKTSTKESKNKRQSCTSSIQKAGYDAGPGTTNNEFLEAMLGVIPLAGNGRSVKPAPDRKSGPQIAQDLMALFMEGKLEFALSNTKEYCEGYVVGLDELTMNKLRSGSLSPEAHLDLHGLNTVQAFEAMRNFMRGSWYKSLRTVLIIPGRGQNSPNGFGVLRNKVQVWLTQEPFKRVVLAFCTAQQLDGGLGSIYVLLRKYKKNGRVYWERTPNDVYLNECV